MIKSMTGFGAAFGDFKGYHCRIEIKTLNNRHKEFVVRSPHQFYQVEEPVKKLLSTRIHRGRVELWIVIEEKSGAARLTLDMDAAEKVYESLQDLVDEFGLEGGVTLDHLLKFDVLTMSKGDELSQDDAELIRESVLELTVMALDQLMVMRMAEGKIMADDLFERIKTLERWLFEIKGLAIDAPLAATKRYQARLEELAETIIEPTRLAHEAAILAEKMDITEEITRFGCHVQNFKKILRDAGDPVGRRLEFLLQEMLREVNTMGSKAQSQPITDMVLNFKSELEKIREQVLNIE